jgi:carbamoylphosphate synthase large subunit
LKIRKTGGDCQEKSACKLIPAEKYEFYLICKQQATILKALWASFKIFAGFEKTSMQI